MTLALFDVDGTLLLTPDLVAVRAILDSIDPSLPDDAFLRHDNAGQTALWQVRQILGREPDPELVRQSRGALPRADSATRRTGARPTARQTCSRSSSAEVSGSRS